MDDVDNNSTVYVLGDPVKARPISLTVGSGSVLPSVDPSGYHGYTLASVISNGGKPLFICLYFS